MNLSSSGVNGILRAYTNQKVALNNSKDSTKAKLGGKDQVELSDRVRNLKRAQEIVAKSSAVRQDKVEELTIAIRQGRYRVDPEKVADCLLAEVRSYHREV